MLFYQIKKKDNLLILLKIIFILLLPHAQSCAAADEGACRRISSLTTGDLSQDLVGAWLSDDALSLLVFSPSGRWVEHRVWHQTPAPTPTRQGDYQAQGSVLTMHDGAARRSERIDALPDRLQIWLFDDAHGLDNPLIYWRAQCDTPPHY